MRRQIGKKFLCAAMTFVMAASCLATGAQAMAAETQQSVSETSEEGTAELASLPSTSGKPIYIYSWDDTLQSKINVILKKYPQYKKLVKYVDLGVGGASDDYKNGIKKAMKTSKAPDIISWDDSMLAYAMNTSYTVPVSSIGYSAKTYKKKAYPYTVANGTSKGKLKAVTWQATPGVYIYNRKKAQKVFGTSDPNKVSKKISTWNKFLSAAKTAKSKGYKIVSGSDDVKYAYALGSKKTLISGTTVSTSVLTGEVSLARKLYVNGYTNNTAMWDSKWVSGMSSSSKVIGYFGTTWLADSMQYYATGCKANEFNICEGPTDYYWGGSYVTVTNKCHNKALTKFILEQLTCTDSISISLYKDGEPCPNNKSAVAKLIKKGYGKNKYIYTNTLKVYDKVARKIPATGVSAKSKYAYDTLTAMDLSVSYIKNVYGKKKVSATELKSLVKSCTKTYFKSDYGVNIKFSK